MLDLVGAGLGVALVPASTALLGVKGVKLRALRRKNDSHVLLPEVTQIVEVIFADIERRAGRLI